MLSWSVRHTVERNDADDEANRKNHHDKRVYFQAWRLVRVQLYDTESVSSSPSLIALRVHILNMVLLLPPAPAARVLVGRAFATLSALSAAAFLLIAVAGPPGGLGDDGRAVVDPVEGELTGEEGRGED